MTNVNFQRDRDNSFSPYLHSLERPKGKYCSLHFLLVKAGARCMPSIVLHDAVCSLSYLMPRTVEFLILNYSLTARNKNLNNLSIHVPDINGLRNHLHFLTQCWEWKGRSRSTSWKKQPSEFGAPTSKFACRVRGYQSLECKKTGAPHCVPFGSRAYRQGSKGQCLLNSGSHEPFRTLPRMCQE